jgi:hypothetical protein
MRILLLDMDGVLVEPRSYHQAFKDTVALVGQILGYPDVPLSDQDVAAFEAAGIASEWDSSAICAALLLENLWSVHPALTLPSVPTAPVLPTHHTTPPDLQSFIDSLSQTHLQEMPPLKRAEHLFLSGPDSYTREQRQALQAILRNARQIAGSLTHCIFQELVLGSRVFTETYGLPPTLDTESYLLEYDRATLPEQARAKLVEWLRDVDHRATVFTSRPSRSVGGQFCPPEAELGARGVGLGMLPIVGLGSMLWLGARRGRDPDSLLKPSPVHALAAMRLALGEPLRQVLEAAAMLGLDGQADDGWSILRGAEVYVFEDTAGGLKSARLAKDMLAGIDVPVEVHLFGVTNSVPKRQALETVGAVVLPTLSVALESVPGYRF